MPRLSQVSREKPGRKPSRPATRKPVHVVFGPGRVGRNMAAYARTLGCTVHLVSRAANEAADDALVEVVRRADVVAFATPDAALPALAARWRPLRPERPTIHFSGATVIPGVWSYHPLYSFPRTRLALKTLRSIAFATAPGAPPFAALYPGARNPTFEVPTERRALYHALAVLAGNLPAFIWNETARTFEAEFGAAPGPLFAGYLHGVVDRFAESPAASATGPVARRDRGTVEANLAALAPYPEIAGLYRAFLEAAWRDFDRGESGA